VLLVVAGLATVTCRLSLAGVPALIIGVVALSRSGDDPARARRLTAIGWFTFVMMFIISVALITLIGTVGLLTSNTSST
jgi:hypothetical protein